MDGLDQSINLIFYVVDGLDGFFDGWIGWINYWMDWMDMSLMDFLDTPISNPYSQDVKLYKDEAYVRDVNKTKKSHILHL